MSGEVSVSVNDTLHLYASVVLSLFLPKTASVHPVIDPKFSACSVLASSEKLKVLFLTVKTAPVTLPYLCLSSTSLSTVASV